MTIDPRGPADHRHDRVAPARATSRILTAGTVLGAVAFGVALAADVLGLGRAAPVGEPDAADLVGGLVALSPWVWALLGSVVVVATPAVGLVVTALEYRSVADRRTALMAVAVLVVLAIGLLVALLA